MASHALLFMFGYLMVSNLLLARGMLCYNDGVKKNTLKYYISNNEEYSFVDFDFAKTPLLPDDLSCSAWLDEIRETDWYKRKDIDFKLLSPKEEKHIRLIGSLKQNMYKHCLQSHRCNVKFPFNLHTPHAALTSQFNRPSTHLDNSTCWQKPIKPQKTAEFFEPLRTLNATQYWISPVQVYSDMLKKVIQESGEDSVIVTAMTLSLSQMKIITKLAESKQHGKIYVLFDLNIALGETGLTHLTTVAGDNVVLMPMISTPEHSSTFHIKGATDTRGQNYVFTTSNLRGQSGSKKMDLGLLGSEGAFSKELARFYGHLLTENCKAFEMLECHLDHSFAENSSRRQTIKELAYRSCQLTKEDPSLLELSEKPYDPKYIFYSRQNNMEAEVLKQLGQAKSKVTITGSFVTNRRVVRKLNYLHRKGIQIHVISGLEKSKYLHKDIAFYRPQKVKIHTKAAIIDDHKLVWTTANFTVSGLKKSREFMFMVDTPHSTEVQLVKKFMNSILKVNDIEPIYAQAELRAASSIPPYHQLPYLLVGKAKDDPPSELRPHKKRTDYWTTSESRCLEDRYKTTLFDKLSQWTKC
jgi:hypothetical protein